MDIESSKLEHKRLNFNLKFMDEDKESDVHEFEAIATTFGNKDRDGDIIQAGAFDEGLKSIDPKLLWQHDMRQPLGTISDIDVNDERITFKGSMPKADEFVAGRVMPQLRHGTLDISIGFMMDDMEWKDEDRIITKGTLFEFSLVTIPANPRATVTDVKTVVPFQDLPLADIDMRWDSTAAIGHVRDFTDSDEEPSRGYRSAFLWFDRGNADEFTAYKLPIADVVDGSLKAVPRGIFAAAAAMQGARGGVDIPDGDRAGVIRNIERYYDKMGRESPFEKGFSPDEIKTLARGDLVKFLRSEPLLSKSGAEYLSQGIMGGSGQAADEEADELRYLSETLNNLRSSSNA